MREDLEGIHPAFFFIGVAIAVGGLAWWVLWQQPWGAYITIVGLCWAGGAGLGARLRRSRDK